MSDIKFGTDGWRGRIAEDYTYTNVRRCTQGFADYLTANGLAGSKVIVGHDKRFSGEHFAAAVAEVLAGNGFRVDLTDKATPTPVISFSVPSRGAVAAVNVTASHNPPEDNGFKVRDENGGAIPPDGLKQIESLIPAAGDVDAVKRLRLDKALASGLVQYFDAKPAYLVRVAELIDVQPIKDAGLTVVVDNMWGNGAGWLSEILDGGKTKIVEVHAERNPSFPEMSRPEPIPPNVDAGLAVGKKLGADCVCIMDGDADRCGFGDEHGEFIDQLRVYGLLAYYLLEIRGQRGTIVKTLSTTSMLDKLGKLYGVPVINTGVGFKFVAPAMMEHDAMIGGEESGGFAFHGHVPERDGIIANLYLLDLMVRTGKTPTQLLTALFEKVGEHFYGRIDTRLTDNEMKVAAQTRLKALKANGIAGLTLGGKKVTELVTLDGYKFVMEDGGWLLIRFSGTEPLIRVYTETTDQSAVDGILEDGKKVAGV
ncbi:MAG: phosphoglucomutase/phosphomannomutase family protein [Caldilineaceae bacterium]|nr:phosphoglucomutase/phosphomannomutase family protein [Caldilineaceae bacterium]MBP8106959.1 phosphoglucomutase/phosphomannomutase family protein [Caldilineaceae bacterium]MBP8121773.1 phosphoglucomutase/phosphomannomutase family protein [Caldilineaceae bacterium]MBP9072375.1 phosphoglucomutase/phosphomannomutase family protein [Caldilineaceae bacterium]